MEIFVIIVAMAVVGVIAGFLAGLIWKENRPLGVGGDYVISVISAILIGLVDWYVIPAMGFSDTIKFIGIATEPLLSALLVLWIIRKAKK